MMKPMREIQSIRARMAGAPTFKNRRLTIDRILYCLANGQRIYELAEEYEIEQNCIKDALRDIADNLYDWMRPEVVYELWESDRSGNTFAPSDRITDMFDGGMLHEDAKMIWTCQARSWIEANEKYHEHMGWEPYKPMLDEDGNVYPEDSGDTV